MQGWEVKPRPVLAAFNLLQKINVRQRELPPTHCQPWAAPGQSTCSPSCRKTPCFQLSPSLIQDINPQECGHFSRNPKIFHFETLETAKLRFQPGCTPSARSPRRVLHPENLDNVDTWPQRPSAPNKPALPSRKNHPAKSLPPRRGKPKAPWSWDDGKNESTAALQKTSVGKILPFSRAPPPLAVPPPPAVPRGCSPRTKPGAAAATTPATFSAPHEPPAAAFCSSCASFHAITGFPPSHGESENTSPSRMGFIPVNSPSHRPVTPRAQGQKHPKVAALPRVPAAGLALAKVPVGAAVMPGAERWDAGTAIRSSSRPTQAPDPPRRAGGKHWESWKSCWHPSVQPAAGKLGAKRIPYPPGLKCCLI